MRISNAIILTLSLAALASCGAAPVQATSPDNVIEMKPASCAETELSFGTSGSQTVSFASGEPMSLAFLAEAHAEDWTYPIDLTIDSGAGPAGCSACMNGDTTLACAGPGPSRQVTVTITANGHPHMPSGFKVTLLASD